MTNRSVAKSGGLDSVLNNTTVALAAGESFTGGWEKNFFPDVMVSCASSAEGTLYFEFANKSNPESEDISTFPVNGFKVLSGKIHEFHKALKGPRWFRVRFVNGSENQSSFYLYTYYGFFNQGNAPLNQTASLDQDAIFTRGTIPQDEIRVGRRSGVTGFTKFALRSGLSASAGQQVIWTASDDTFTPMTSAETYTISYNQLNDGLGTNGALTLAITHVNSDGNPEIFIHTLGDDGSDVTSASGYGINRVAVASSGSSNYNVNDITVTSTISETTQAHVQATNGVTQQAIFHTGFNSDAVGKWLWVLHNKLSGGGDVRAVVRGFIFNKIFQNQYLVFRGVIDTRSKPEIDITDPVGFNFSPSDVIWFTIDTDSASSDRDWETRY